MAHPNCPVCNNKLEFKSLNREKDSVTNHYHCTACKINYHADCPQGGKPRWFAHIALGTFPKGAWETFLFTEWNYYGQVMPERASFGDSVSEREKREAAEWYKQHPREACASTP